MQTVSQSSFLQALGYAIANSLWQVALLWLIAVIINACFKLSSHNRYRVAITAQLGGFVWFVITLQFYYQQCIQATANAQLLLQQHAVLYQPAIISYPYNILSYIIRAEMLLPYLSLAYLCLLGVLAIRWLKSYRHTYVLKHEGLQKAAMDLRLFVQEMAVQLGIKQRVKVYLSTLVNCPLTIGFLKPIILVPVATINHLTTQQLEAVLLHELAHIRRADYIINLLLNIIETILFFNPFTRLISKNINKEREHCCDDWVLQFNYNAPMYAEALLRIACLQASPAMVMKAEGKGEGELLWRIKRLLNQQQKRFNYSQQMIALVVTTCMLVSIAWLQPANTAKQPPATAANKSQKAVVVAPLSVQINNPFFNPLAFLAKPLKAEVQKATQEITKTNLQEAIGTGLNEAAKQLTAIAPTVVHEIRKIDTNNNFEEVKKGAEKELQKVKWAELQQLFPSIDSVRIASAVTMAINKQKLSVNMDKIIQSLAASRQQLLKLKQENFEALLNQSYLNAAVNNTLAWINESNLNKTWAENNKNAISRETEEKRSNQRRQEIILRNLPGSRVAPLPAENFTLSLPKRRKESDKPAGAMMPQDHADELANWSYTNPVYIEKATDNRDADADDSVYSYTVQPQLVPPTPPVKPVVQVVEITKDAAHLSITITIKQ